MYLLGYTTEDWTILAGLYGIPRGRDPIARLSDLRAQHIQATGGETISSLLRSQSPRNREVLPLVESAIKQAITHTRRPTR